MEAGMGGMVVNLLRSLSPVGDRNLPAPVLKNISFLTRG